MNRAERLAWLRETDPRRLDALWAEADAVRRRHVGDAVHLRGLIEFANRCGRGCLYCGLRRQRADVVRYRMTLDEIVACARTAYDLGMGTVVLQSGEDASMPATWLAEVIVAIKEAVPVAATLSVGERSRDDYALWRRAGADRYLLRFETSNPDLYARLHPDAKDGLDGRLAALYALRDLDYEVGSGVMVGLPGQTCEDLAGDLALFERVGLHMVGLGPYVAHPDTPLAHVGATDADQVPSSETTASIMVALTRLVLPDTNIPATTALATISPTGGRMHGLQRGGNVVMPNVTPAACKRRYEIYPAKAGVTVDVVEAVADVRRTLDALGRTVGIGRGDSPAKTGVKPAPVVTEEV